MTLLLKDPDAVLDYAVDWGSDYLRDGDLLAASQWLVDPNEAGGVTVAGDDFDSTVTTVKLSGGVAGHVYRVTNRVTTQSGRVDDRSIVLRVEDR